MSEKSVSFAAAMFKVFGKPGQSAREFNRELVEMDQTTRLEFYEDLKRAGADNVAPPIVAGD